MESGFEKRLSAAMQERARRDEEAAAKIRAEEQERVRREEEQVRWQNAFAVDVQSVIRDAVEEMNRIVGPQGYTIDQVTSGFSGSGAAPLSYTARASGGQISTEMLTFALNIATGRVQVRLTRRQPVPDKAPLELSQEPIPVTGFSAEDARNVLAEWFEKLLA
jgi:hypothetical protein